MSKAAKHTNYSFQDQQSVGLVSAWIAESKRAMPDLKANDKWPNIDGYVELTDLNGYPLGNIKVQIKKLSKKNAKDKKHTFKNDKFLAYCRETTDWIPIIFIGVDLDNDIAYWVHIDDGLLSSIGTGKTITLDAKKFLKKSDYSFVDEWIKIHELYSSKSSKFEEYKKSYSILADIVTPALGVSRDYFINIHVFLDTLNTALENDFPHVKRVFYPNIWKLGLAYYKYLKDELSYTIYPIAYDKNDVQIKEIDKYIHDQIQSEGLGFTGHFRENPIAVDPIKYSYTVLQSKLDSVLEGRILNHTGSEFLAKEFIFAFIDKFHLQMGLVEKDKYNLEEVLFGYNVYMPLWIEESLKFMFSVNRNNIKERVFRRPIDPDSMISEIMPEERQKIKQVIEFRIKNNKLETNKYIIEHSRLPFRTFVEMLRYLQALKLEIIKREYKKKDFERLSKVGSHSVYDTLSREDLTSNLKVFFDNVASSFDVIMKNNFPKLRNSVKLWGGANKVLVNIELKDSYQGMDDPGLNIIFLEGKGDLDLSVEFVEDKSEWEEIRKSIYSMKDTTIIYKNKKYSPLSWTIGSLRFMFSDTPMFEYLYELLIDAFKEYFKNRTYDRRIS